MEPVLSILHTVPRADCLPFHFIFPKSYVVGLLYHFAEGLIESYGTSGCLSPELMSALGKLYQWLIFHNSDFFFGDLMLSLFKCSSSENLLLKTRGKLFEALDRHG